MHYGNENIHWAQIPLTNCKWMKAFYKLYRTASSRLPKSIRLGTCKALWYCLVQHAGKTVPDLAIAIVICH